mgnify:FL=1
MEDKNGAYSRKSKPKRASGWFHEHSKIDNELKQWKSRDLDARMEIIMHLSDEQVDHVRDLETAQQMWEYLRKLHQPSDGTTKIFSYRTLMNLEMHEGEQLDAVKIGNNIDETSKCEILMGALPSSWMTFVSIHSEDKDLNLQNLIAKLKQDELRRKRTNTQHEVSHMAMAASMRNQPRNFYKQKFQKFQPKTKPSGSGAITISTIICRYCNKLGHFERDCRKKQYDLKGKGKRVHPQAHSALVQNPNPSYSEDEDNNFIQAFMSEMEDESTNQKNDDNNLWFFDTGATHHLTNNWSLLHNYRLLSQPLEVRFGDNGMKVAIGKGEVHLSISHSKSVSIPNVYYVPGIIKNLLSVSEATANGTIIEFHCNCAIIYHKLQTGGTVKITCPKSGRLYPLQMVDKTPIQALTATGYIHADSTLLWHHRLGHLNPKSMKTGQIHKLLEGIPTRPFKYISVCEGCIYGKQCRQKFATNNNKKTERPLQVVHSDLCGPMQTTSLDGNRYFISFIDDFTRFTILYFLKEKSGAFKAFISYKAYVENHGQHKISTIRSDNGGEYFSKEWIKFCEDHGIRHEHTVPYNPQQNGIVERKNMTLLDASRCMLQVAGLHNQFWEEAVATACYVQNRSPHKVLGLNTPYAIWYGHKPHLGHLRVFGCIAYSHIPQEKRRKLDPHARKCIFTGYGEASGVKAYRLFDLHTRKFLFSRSVTFDEATLMKQYANQEVQHLNENFQNELTFSSDSQIVEYGGPSTRDRSKRLQQNQSHGKGKQYNMSNKNIFMQGAWNNEEITNHPKSINSSGQNIAKSENQYGGNNKFKQKIQFGYGIPRREDQRDDNMAESESDGAKISSNRNIPATNNDNFIFESNGGHIIRSETHNNHIFRSENQGIILQNKNRSEENYDNIVPENEGTRRRGHHDNHNRRESHSDHEEMEMIHQEKGILSSPPKPHQRALIPAHKRNRGLTHRKDSNDEESTLEEETNIKTKPKHKYRSLKEIMDDTDPLEALMVDVGDEEYSNSSPLEEEDEMILGESISLTSSEALDGPFKNKWHQAMTEEVASLLKNGTWELVPRPKNRKVISSKWVLKVKTDANGNPIRFKARVVARGFTQVQGIDFKETFAPTLRISPVRLVWGITAALNLELHHLDVETAFLHGDLEEEIYMEQPPHFQDPKHPTFVCKLKKSIYGLKQSPRMWHTKLHSHLIKIMFKRLASEPNLYIRKVGNIFVILGVYVDDLLIASNSIEALHEATNQLQQAFPVKDLGPMEYCLGIKVSRNRIEGTLSISQKKTIEEILRKYEMQECKPTPTPMTAPYKLSIEDGPKTMEEIQFMKTIPYRQILGSIRYLVSCTRPDLSFSAGYLSRFMQNPGVKHWEALKRVIRYLKHTKDMVITYKSLQSWNPSSLEGWLTSPLQGWTDSDWGGGCGLISLYFGNGFHVCGWSYIVENEETNNGSAIIH